MSANVLCDPYIWESPSILLKTSPFRTAAYSCASELVNQIVVIILIFIAFGSIVSAAIKNANGVLGGLCIGILFSIPNIITLIFIKRESENFTDATMKEKAKLWAKNRAENDKAGVKFAEEQRRKIDDLAPAVGVIGSKNTGIQSKPYKTDPSARNPFMNVLIDELKYNPGRPRAASVLDPVVKVELDDFFRTEFFNDPTDVFGRKQGQRQFVTQPATSIPNDVDSYQNWLYRIPGKTCKEGNPDACVPGTNGAVMPWLSK